MAYLFGSKRGCLCVELPDAVTSGCTSSVALLSGFVCFGGVRADAGPVFITARKECCMATGIVKWFNDAKGYGFITPDQGGEDLFAHFSEVQGNGFRSLKEGQRVEFEIKQGPKGRQASTIKPL
jgi:cold shock protein